MEILGPMVLFPRNDFDDVALQHRTFPDLCPIRQGGILHYPTTDNLSRLALIGGQRCVQADR